MLPSTVLRSRLTTLLMVGIAILPFGLAARAADAGATERWYEILRRGAKVGHSRVVWAPSTWNARKTVHDTTTTSTRSVRTMAGFRDVFETITTTDLERGDDGTLWWMQTIVEEAGRLTTTELEWTGKGYTHVTRLDGEERAIEISLDAPVMVDLEAFLGSRIRAGTVEAGSTFDLRLLDVVGRRAHVTRLEILGRTEIEDAAASEEGGEPKRIPCFHVRETDPRSGAVTQIWIDDDGAFVRLIAEGGLAYRRVARGAAEKAPVRAAEYSITTPATPTLERIMSADRLWVDLHLQADPDRPLPEFPESPWSRVLALEGDDTAGWVAKLRIDAYKRPEITAALPLNTLGKERHLEATVLMPSGHEHIQAVVREVVGDERDARTAAYRLARYVFESLEKKSPEVAQASALEILEAGCGDCSEHALLFVTLCRAAGIPARHCSGYVCIGSDWGAHAWAEIWLGGWVGADPTTGEVGTGARYLLFGYYDDPTSFPGLVSARARDRMRFVTTRLVEGDDDVDLRDELGWRIQDKAAGHYVHALAGLEAREAPRDWVVRLLGSQQARVRTPTVRAEVYVSADQGFDLDVVGGADSTFAGAPARRIQNMQGVMLFVHSRRRLIRVIARGDDVEAFLERFETVFAPTFADPPTAAPATEEVEAPVGD